MYGYGGKDNEMYVSTECLLLIRQFTYHDQSMSFCSSFQLKKDSCYKFGQSFQMQDKVLLQFINKTHH